jgi:glycosyltransferase involved in cell wall biosynthesis
MIEAFRREGHAALLASPSLAPGERAPAGAFAEAGPAVELLALPPDPAHERSVADLKSLESALGVELPLRRELRALLFNQAVAATAEPAFRGKGVEFVYERYSLAAGAGPAIAKRLGVPHLLEVNAPLVDERHRVKGLAMLALARALERETLRRAGALLVVSQQIADWAHGLGVPRERIHVVPNGVDPARFEPALTARTRRRAELGAGDRCVIGFVGGLRPWHGTELLLEAFAQLRARGSDALLLVVGDGPLGDELRRRAQQAPLAGRVTFTGALPHDEAAEWLAAMDIATAPYPPQEPFYFSPLKLFEYMVMGVSIVASRIGQIADVVEDNVSGVLVPPGDVPALTGALESLARDPARRAALGRAGRERVLARYTWRENARRAIAIAGELRAAR